MTRALILGGTNDANRLAEAAAERGLDAIYSYAGRTQAPARQALPTRIGGFGGTGGLIDYIRQQGISHVVDATHPFAVEISRNAVAACATTGIALIALERAPWKRSPGDNWIEVEDLAAAVVALPEQRARIFLAIGRRHLGAFAARPQHAYTLRLADAPDAALPLPYASVVVSRGPFTLQGDRDLLRSRDIEWIVARNAGGSGALAKIEAARQLGLPVIMIARPQLPDRPSTESLGEVLGFLGHDACLGV
jgi:precorrin-6A/cobalt-precorrin-6A reductase